MNLDTGSRPLFVFVVTGGYTWLVLCTDQPQGVIFIAGLFITVPFVVSQWLAARRQTTIEGRRFELQYTFAILTHFTAGFGVALAINDQRPAAIGALGCVVMLMVLEHAAEKMLDRQASS